MIHARIVISAMVTPLDLVRNALRLSTCPKNVTKTVTNDNSMLFANAAHRSEAVDGVSFPVVVICRPYRGLRIAIRSHSPEKTEEYIANTRIVTASQLRRP